MEMQTYMSKSSRLAPAPSIRPLATGSSVLQPSTSFEQQRQWQLQQSRQQQQQQHMRVVRQQPLQEQLQQGSSFPVRNLICGKSSQPTVHGSSRRDSEPTEAKTAPKIAKPKLASPMDPQTKAASLAALKYRFHGNCAPSTTNVAPDVASPKLVYTTSVDFFRDSERTEAKTALKIAKPKLASPMDPQTKAASLAALKSRFHGNWAPSTKSVAPDVAAPKIVYTSSVDSLTKAAAAAGVEVKRVVMHACSACGAKFPSSEENTAHWLSSHAQLAPGTVGFSHALVAASKSGRNLVHCGSPSVSSNVSTPVRCHQPTKVLSPVRSTDPDGDSGIWCGPVDLKGRPEGNGKLVYSDKGFVFFGEASCGRMNTGVVYSTAGSAQFTMISGEWTVSLDAALVVLFPFVGGLGSPNIPNKYGATSRLTEAPMSAGNASRASDSGDRSVVACDDMGRPTIVRHAERTIVFNEDGSQRIFTEELVVSIADSTEDEIASRIYEMTLLHLRGLVHELSYRVCEGSSVYHRRREELDQMYQTKSFLYFGLPENATEKDLETVYRRFARAMHPDKNGGTDDAKERFQNMKQRYEDLKAVIAADSRAASAALPKQVQPPKEKGSGVRADCMDTPERREAYDLDSDADSGSQDSGRRPQDVINCSSSDRNVLETNAWKMLRQLRAIRANMKRMDHEPTACETEDAGAANGGA